MLIIIEWTIGPMIRVRIVTCYWEVSYFTYDLRPCQKVIFEKVSRNAAHHLPLPPTLKLIISSYFLTQRVVTVTVTEWQSDIMVLSVRKYFIQMETSAQQCWRWKEEIKKNVAPWHRATLLRVIHWRRNNTLYISRTTYCWAKVKFFITST